MVGQRESGEPWGEDKPNQVVQEIMMEGLLCSETSDDSGMRGRKIYSIHMNKLGPLSTR